MVKTAGEFVVVRNKFYETRYKQAKLLVTLLLISTILLIGLAVYQAETLRPMPRYFPTTPDGRLIKIPPNNINSLVLSQQKLTSNGMIEGMPPPVRSFRELQPDGEQALVLYWAKLAAEFMFDYDYVHFRKVIQDSARYFTPKGHKRFIEALVSSKNLETVKARSAIVVPTVTGPVRLLGTRMVKGHYVWDLRLPIQLKYESVEYAEPLVQNLVATMSVARVSTLLSPFYGLSIFRLNFQEIFEEANG